VGKLGLCRENEMKIKLSKLQWQEIGEVCGWAKTAAKSSRYKGYVIPFGAAEFALGDKIDNVVDNHAQFENAINGEGQDIRGKYEAHFDDFWIFMDITGMEDNDENLPTPDDKITGYTDIELPVGSPQTVQWQADQLGTIMEKGRKLIPFKIVQKY
jgi:hypothetical protein